MWTRNKVTLEIYIRVLTQRNTSQYICQHGAHDFGLIDSWMFKRNLILPIGTYYMFKIFTIQMWLFFCSIVISVQYYIVMYIVYIMFWIIPSVYVYCVFTLRHTSGASYTKQDMMHYYCQSFLFFSLIFPTLLIDFVFVLSEFVAHL